MERYNELKELRLEIQRKAGEINRLTASKRFAKSSNLKVIEAQRDQETDSCLIEAQAGSVMTSPNGLNTIKVLNGSILTQNGKIQEGQLYHVSKNEELRFESNTQLLMNWTVKVH